MPTANVVAMLLKELKTMFAVQLAWLYMLVVSIHWCSFWRAWLWHTSASLCKNENGICTQVELQAVAGNYLVVSRSQTLTESGYVRLIVWMGKDVVEGIE